MTFLYVNRTMQEISYTLELKIYVLCSHLVAVSWSTTFFAATRETAQHIVQKVYEMYKVLELGTSEKLSLILEAPQNLIFFFLLTISTGLVFSPKRKRLCTLTGFTQWCNRRLTVKTIQKHMKQTKLHYGMTITTCDIRILITLPQWIILLDYLLGIASLSSDYILLLKMLKKLHNASCLNIRNTRL